MKTKKLFSKYSDWWICRRIWWKFHDSYYSIRNFIFPRQRWLVSKIPNSHRDTDCLIEIVLLECLVHYVKVELKWADFNEEDYKDFPEHQIEFNKELWANYLKIKKDLPLLESELELEWERVGDVREKLDKKATYDEIYGKVNKLEEKIEKLKTEVFTWMILNRRSMWT